MFLFLKNSILMDLRPLIRRQRGGQLLRAHFPSAPPVTGYGNNLTRIARADEVYKDTGVVCYVTIYTTRNEYQRAQSVDSQHDWPSDNR